MKRFRFPLRPVAVLRAHRESRAREAFATAVHAYVKAEEFLAAARARVAALATALFSRRTGSFNAGAEAHGLAAYRSECAAELDAERASFAARAEMDRRRADYLEAHRKLEVVRRLEAKARDEHRLAAGREEQAEFDDYAGRSAARRAALSTS